MILITLPHDLPVSVAAKVGAWLEKFSPDDWQILPGEFTNLAGMNEPGRSFYIRKISGIIDRC